MTQIPFADRLRYMLVDPHYPNAGIEFSRDSIRLAVTDVQRGKIVLQHLDHEPLPDGALDVSPFKPNIQSMEAAATALKSLWSRNRYKSSRVCLLLQDRAALTFHLSLEHPAKNAGECLDLIRFKLRKNVPFKIEESQIAYFNSSGAHDPASTQLWVVVINHQVLHQYEQFVLSVTGAECGLVDLATFNFMNLTHSDVKAGGLKDDDLLYVNLNRDYISIAISQKSHLMFFRSRPIDTGNANLETAMTEIHPATLYYQDKLGGQSLSRAFVHGEETAENLTSEIEKHFGIPSVLLSIEPYAGTRFDSSNKTLLRRFAPLAGLLISRKVEYQ